MGLAQAETDHLSETKIYNLHPYKERRSASRHFYTGFPPPPPTTTTGVCARTSRLKLRRLNSTSPSPGETYDVPIRAYN